MAPVSRLDGLLGCIFDGEIVLVTGVMMQIIDERDAG
jgi:hypothetical protein